MKSESTKSMGEVYFKVIDSAPEIIGSVGKLHNPLSAVTSKGYRRGRLRKDSPEAKAYMARLRAMRRRRYLLIIYLL